FLPAAGPMYIRFEITRTNGDWVIYFDDIEMTQGTPPPMCTTPDDVTSLNLTSTSTTVTGTFTSNGDVSGFLVIRSTDIILSTLPTDGFVYGVGNEVGGGVVVANTTDTSFSDSTVSSNTTYYYHVFAYNNHPDNDCLAAYSIFSATQNTTTCPSTPIIVGASNVRTSDAVLNWTPGLYADNTGVTYTVNISTSSDFNILSDSDSGLVGTSYTLTGLIANTTYYWR